VLRVVSEGGIRCWVIGCWRSECVKSSTPPTYGADTTQAIILCSRLRGWADCWERTMVKLCFHGMQRHWLGRSSVAPKRQPLSPFCLPSTYLSFNLFKPPPHPSRVSPDRKCLAPVIRSRIHASVSGHEKKKNRVFCDYLSSDSHSRFLFPTRTDEKTCLNLTDTLPEPCVAAIPSHFHLHEQV